MKGNAECKNQKFASALAFFVCSSSDFCILHFDFCISYLGGPEMRTSAFLVISTPVLR